MTSSHCFSRIGRQNMRHSTWMWALSFVGNLLAMPVVMLLAIGENQNREIDVDYLMNRLVNLFVTQRLSVIVFASIVAALGAIIVGIVNYRYLLHKNMVDTYHSLPVKRNTMFFANWLNGFLIWFVPFVLNLVLTMVIAVAKINSLKKQIHTLSAVLGDSRKIFDVDSLSEYTAGKLLGGMLIDALLVVVVFLMIYHLTIAVMMLCGNVLNVLVSEVILGSGVMAVYGVILALCETFLDTFISGTVTLHRGFQYASPFVSTVMMMVSRMQYYDVAAGAWGEWWVYLIVNTAIALVLLALAAFLYQKRPSELAEQGLRAKWARYPLQLLASVFAGISGWWIFYVLSSSTRDAYNTAWGCFGVVVGAGIVFGAMNIVTFMDFKAFFKHKLLMALTVVGTILLCLSVRLDWYGYDSYLPRQGQIAEIAVYHGSFGNILYLYPQVGDLDHPLERMHITDTELAYQLLCGCVDTAQDINSSMVMADVIDPTTQSTRYLRREQIRVKVTKKNGRSYYRSYRISSKYEAVLRQILESPEYVQACYQLEDDFLSSVTYLELNNAIRDMASARVKAGEDRFEGFAREFTGAYQRDMELHPAALTTRGGDLLCRLEGHKQRFFGIDINENMTETVEVLRRYGFEEMVNPVTEEMVEEILVPIRWEPEEAQFAYEDMETEETAQKYGFQPSDPETQERLASGEWVYSDRYGYCAVVKDPVEIREMLQAESFHFRVGYSLFGDDTRCVYLKLWNQEIVDSYVLYEEMPEGLQQRARAQK